MAVQPAAELSDIPEFPALSDRALGTYNDKAYGFGSHMGAPGPFVGEMNALAANVEHNATEAGSSAVTAAEKVGEATDAATAASGFSGSAASSAAAAAGSASSAAASASGADASRIQASKLNLGGKSSPPTVDNQGDPLLQGATYYDTTLDKWRVWTGAAWGDGISSISGVSSVNGATGNVTVQATLVAGTNIKTLNGVDPIGPGDAVVPSRTKVWTVIAATGSYIVPVGVNSIRVYCNGKGGNGFGSSTANLSSSGGAAGMAYGDIAVAPGDMVNVDITSGVAKVNINGGPDLLVGNPGGNAASGVAGTAGTASKHASVTNGGAYSGGVGVTGTTGGAPGGGSGGSPLGNGFPGGSSAADGGAGGAGIGGAGGGGAGGGGGGAGGAGAAGAVGTARTGAAGGAGGGAPSTAGNQAPGRANGAEFTDPLLRGFISPGALRHRQETANDDATGTDGGPGSGGSGAASTLSGSEGGDGGDGGGGGGGYCSTGIVRGGKGGLLGGGGGARNVSGTAIAGDGGDGGGGGGACGSAATAGNGGRAAVRIYC